MQLSWNKESCLLNRGVNLIKIDLSGEHCNFSTVSSLCSNYCCVSSTAVYLDYCWVSSTAVYSDYCCVSSTAVYSDYCCVLGSPLRVQVLWREAGDVWYLPPVWNLRAVIWFHFAISCLFHLPTHFALSLLPDFFPSEKSSEFFISR